MRAARGRTVRVVGLLLLLFGCASSPAPVGMEPHLVAGVPGDVAPDRPRIGLGRFVDARPRSDQLARRPSFRIRGAGIGRRGEIQTGDGSFSQRVSELVRRDAGATLERSGVFFEVRFVDVGDAEGAPSIPAGLDFLLVATIEELVGIQQQDFNLPFVPLQGYRNRLGDPSGIVRVGYRLYDARGLVLEERIETVLTRPGSTPAGAASDATARTNERLAQRLFVRLVPERDRVRRRVSVRVLDGCGLGRERVGLLVRHASGVLEREAGIRLVPDWRRAEPARFPDLRSALVSARRTRPPSALVLSLVRLSGPETERFGLADPLGNHAVAVCNAEGDARVATIAHEVGHLFGAVHVDDRGSVMHPVAEFDGRFFDPLNREILRTAWSRPIGSPLPRTMRDNLETLYRAALTGTYGVDREEVHDLLAVLLP